MKEGLKYKKITSTKTLRIKRLKDDRLKIPRVI